MRTWLIILCCLPALVASLRGEVLINEVLFDPEGVDTGEEWVELLNSGTETINLRDYLLDADGPNFMLPDYLLPPGEILTVHTNFQGDPYVEDGHMYLFNQDHNLGNSHGFVGLWRPNDFGQVAEFFVSYVAYGAPGQTWESQAVTAGIWYDGEFVPDVAAGHSIHWDGCGVGAAFWYDDPEPVPGPSEVITEIPGTDSAPATAPGSLLLLPNYPNPFNSNTRIRFQLGERALVNLALLNLLGETVMTPLRSTSLAPGEHCVEVDLNGFPSGTYFCRLSTARESRVQAISYIQ